MPSQKQPGEIFPYWSVPPVVVIRELCARWPKSGQTMLCVSDDWQFVRGEASPRNLEPKVPRLSGPPLHLWLRDHMAESSQKPQDGESEPPTNYGRQK